MITILMVLAALQPGSDSVIRRARAVAAAFGDTAAARAAGFGPLIVGRMVDLTPFQGQHWLHRWHLFGDSQDLSTPSFVMFAPVDGSWRVAGLAYTSRRAPNSAVPETLGGITAPWHLHQPCVVVPGEGVALADGDADCRARGGVSRPPEIAMVHAWTVPNPEGLYAHDNVALPYWVVGAKPPRVADLSTRPRATLTRTLGLALGESYGAIMPYARLIEATTMMPGFADSIRVHRAELRRLVPLLVRAEKAGNPAEQRVIAGRLVREWQILRRLYVAAAPSPEIRAQLERQFARALGEDPGHHMH